MLLLTVILHQRPVTTVDFEDRSAAATALTGTYGGIDWGSNVWFTQFFTGYNHYAYVNDGSTTEVSKTFTLPAGKVLKSIRATAPTAGAYIKVSQPGNAEQQFNLTSSYQTFNTGLTSATGGSVTIKIFESSAAWNTAIDSLAYDNADAPLVTTVDFEDRPCASTVLTGTYGGIDWGISSD